MLQPWRVVCTALTRELLSYYIAPLHKGDFDSDRSADNQHLQAQAPPEGLQPSGSEAEAATAAADESSDSTPGHEDPETEPLPPAPQATQLEELDVGEEDMMKVSSTELTCALVGCIRHDRSLQHTTAS